MAQIASRPGILRRLASMCYDFLLLIGVLVVLLLLPHALIGHFLHRMASPVILWAHLFLVLAAYFVGFWSFRGQTLAMRTWRVRLTTRTGRAPGPAQALLRFLLCWPSILLCGLGIVWAVFDPERQFLHDRIVGTRVVFDSDKAGINAVQTTRSTRPPPA